MSDINIQSSELSPEDLASIRELARKDLYFFAKAILGYDRLNPRIHKPLCRLLEQYETKTRLKITLPRGWYKTTLCSIAYPLWRAIRNSNIRILLVQNTHTNAIGKLASIDKHFRQNELFRALFPELMPNKQCEWTREKMCVPRTSPFPEGTFEAAGIRTAVTSRHYDCIIQDDTVSPDLDDLGEENLVPSKDDIGQAIGWHRLAMPLLTNAEKDQILVVGTRWFEKDLLSWIGENEPSYHSYIRSCLELNGISDEAGEPTFPEQFPTSVLTQLKAGMGPYMFSCLYLNRPIRSGDMLFQQDWFQYYDTLPGKVVYYTTVDPGGDPEDTKGEPDWNVVMTCGLNLVTGIAYVVHYDREKCSPGRLIDIIFEHIINYRPVKLGIEAVAYQKMLQHFIRERMKKQQLYVMIEPITHGKRSKNARIMGLQPGISAGTILFRQHHRAILSEALAFPYGKNDDLLDTLAMQHGLWALTRSPSVAKEQQLRDPCSLESVLASVHEKRRLDKRRTHLLDILKPKQKQQRITFRNGRMVVA